MSHKPNIIYHVYQHDKLTMTKIKATDYSSRNFFLTFIQNQSHFVTYEAKAYDTAMCKFIRCIGGKQSFVKEMPYLKYSHSFLWAK